MEFVHGIKVNDTLKLKEMGLECTDVASLVCSLFGDMIYFHGFVHCDPHPGNIFVRFASSNAQTPQIVLLDHGMYRRLDPKFRYAYCLLWKALITRDVQLGKESLEALGVPGGSYDLLSIMLTYSTPGSKAKLGSRMSTEEIAKLRKKYEGISAKDVNTFLENLPRDLLFVMRT